GAVARCAPDNRARTIAPWPCLAVPYRSTSGSLTAPHASELTRAGSIPRCSRGELQLAIFGRRRCAADGSPVSGGSWVEWAHAGQRAGSARAVSPPVDEPEQLD